jgi:hypothetical protein
VTESVEDNVAAPAKVVAPVTAGADGNVAAPAKVVLNYPLMIPLERVPLSDSQNVGQSD